MGRRKANKRKRAAAEPEPTKGASGGPAVANPPGASDAPPPKKVKTFDERWKTATKTAEQVLGT